MSQDVLGALWFITLLIGIYGMATGDSAFGDAAITRPRAYIGATQRNRQGDLKVTAATSPHQSLCQIDRVLPVSAIYLVLALQPSSQHIGGDPASGTHGAGFLRFPCQRGVKGYPQRP